MTGWQVKGNPFARPMGWDSSVRVDHKSRGWAETSCQVLLLALLSLCSGWESVGFCQDQEQTPPKPNRNKQEPPKPKYTVTEVELTTKDGFPLQATWYEGDRGTGAGAILMLHDLGRTRRDFEALATFFANNGHCVLVPDLRGHGDSALDAAGQKYAPKKYGQPESLAIQTDIEACKKFLVQKNDAEICNIELMVIVTCGATSIPTLSWCVVDWSYLPAVVKQGQDVKAVVMLGPVRSHQSWQINPLVKTPLLSGSGHPQPLELMLISGEKSGSFRDTKSLYSSWSASRGRKDEEDNWEKHNIYLLTTESAHDGIASVMRHPDLVPDAIFDFFENRVFNRAEEYGHKSRSTSKPVDPATPVIPPGLPPAAVGPPGGAAPPAAGGAPAGGRPAGGRPAGPPGRGPGG
jgi:hypothetical protein